MSNSHSSNDTNHDQHPAASLSVAAQQGELKTGTMKSVTINGKAVLLCHIEEGYYAIEDLCTHEDYPLNLGCLKGNEIECSLHGACYNIKTGEPTAEPGEIPLKTFPVHIKGNDILIEV